MGLSDSRAVRLVFVSVLHACAAMLASSASAQAHEGKPATIGALPQGARFALLPSVTAQARELSATPAQRYEAVRGLTFALRKRGYELMPSDEVNTTLEKHVADGCRDAVTCDPALALQALGADAVISLALWHRDDGKDQVFVHVKRKAGYGQSEVTIGPSGIGTAAAVAINRALDDTLVQHEARVRIQTQPAGANVRIDQALVGKTPLTVELSPGNHLVSLEARGYVSNAHYIEVSASSDKPLVHEVTLLRAQPGEHSSSDAPLSVTEGEATSTSHAAADGGPSVANYVLAGVLGAAAVPLIINAVYAGSRNGECTGRTDVMGHCDARANLGAAFWASLGFGIAAGVGSAALLVFQPIAATGDASIDGAHLEWRGSF